MSLTKVTYVDGVTVIGAQNLNDIQDAIIASEQSEADLVSAVAQNAADIAANTQAISGKADKDDVTAGLAEKLNVNQGAGSAGRYLAVGNDGSVTAEAPDDAPVDGSKKLVESGGVFDAVDTVADAAELATRYALEAFTLDTASGSVASSPDGADDIPVKSLTVGIRPVQAGSGDPSPTNVRPLSGRTGLTVYHAGADTASPESTSVSWESEAGTVYAGTLDVTTGVLTATHNILSFDGTERWSWYAPSNSALLSGALSGRYGVGNTVSLYGYCSTAAPEATGELSNRFIQATGVSTYNLQCSQVGANYNIENSVDAWKAKLAAMHAAGTPLQLVYRIASPRVFQLTAQEVSTLLGVNNFWSDAGNTTVIYRVNPEKAPEPLPPSAYDTPKTIGVRTVLGATKWVQGACLVGRRVVGFEASRDDHSNYVTYRVYDADNNLANAGFGRHNLGHAPSADYCSDTDTMVVTNGTYAAGVPQRVYLVKGAAQIINNGGDISVGDANVLEFDMDALEGREIVACFGETSKYLYVTTVENPNSFDAYPQKFIYKFILGTGATDMNATFSSDNFGTFVSGCAEGEYNGTAHLLEKHALTVYGELQGNTYRNGYLYLCTDTRIFDGVLTPAIVKISVDGEAIVESVHRIRIMDDVGVPQQCEPQGLVFDGSRGYTSTAREGVLQFDTMF